MLECFISGSIAPPFSKIYLTTYSTTTFKNFVKDNNTFERDFREYIAYLPTYSYTNHNIYVMQPKLVTVKEAVNKLNEDLEE